MAEWNCDAKVMKRIAKILNNQSQFKKKRKSHVIGFWYNASNLYGLTNIQKSIKIQNAMKEQQ